MSALRLADPLWLLALPLAAALAAWARRRRPGAVLYSSCALLEGAPRSPAQRFARLLPAFRSGALALGVLALARPQLGLEEFRVRAEGIALVMAIDRSGSMQALDLELEGKRADRLAVTKDVFRRFVTGEDGGPGRRDDRIGLVAFGGFPEDRCPLTLDHGALLRCLEEVRIPEPWIGADGEMVARELHAESMETAIGDAIALAVERLKEVDAKSKVVILLSDGEQTAGVLAPAEAAQAAARLGVRIHSIGIGTNGAVPMPVHDRFGNVSLQLREVRLDERTLREVAETTGGRYWSAQDTAALEQVCAEIDALEKSATEGAIYTDHRELYRHALLPALALLLLDFVLRATRLRTLP